MKMMTLEKMISRLEMRLPDYQIFSKSVSDATVGWQIEHSVLTINKIIEALESSKPENYKWKFNLGRILVLTINKIPRGRAKAPKVVRPKEIFDFEEVKNQLDQAKINLNKLDKLSPNCFFFHPYFGDLNLQTTIKFLKIHTFHHLKIIEDIIQASKNGVS